MSAAGFYVYLHRRLTDGIPFYVGKGRGRRASTTRGRNSHWHRIVAKDGGYAISFLAQEIGEELALLAEVEAIDQFRRLGYPLANKTNGGEGVSGYVWSAEERQRRIAVFAKPEVKEKQRAAKLGKGFSDARRLAMSERMKADPRVQQRAAPKRPQGFMHSEESRQKMSDARKGKPPANKGKTMLPHVKAALDAAQSLRTNFSPSDETRRKLSISNTGLKRSEQARANMSSAQSVAVLCVDTGEIFKSALEAAQRFGANNRTLVGDCCRNKRTTAYGMRFRYVKDISDGAR